MACPQGPTYSTYRVRVPASGVGYVPRTVAPQDPPGVNGATWDNKDVLPGATFNHRGAAGDDDGHDDD